jgi:uncharacterized SAM-binding protein YcdF (DUF218 family)
MLILKKLVSSFLMPMPICLGIVAVGVILLWFTSRQRAGRLLVTIGASLLTLFSYRGVANLFIRPLENDYQPLLVEGRPDALDARARTARWIVVLGGGHSLDRHLPANTELTESTLARLIEALRLKKQLPAARLILSGGFGRSGITHAQLLADAAVELGFSRDDLVLEQRTFDTADEARLIGARVGADPFILVSSASHLPRAVALFRKQGRDPLPSPTGFTVIPDPGINLDDCFPASSGVGKLERAWHEYIGFVWSRMRHQL